MKADSGILGSNRIMNKEQGILKIEVYPIGGIFVFLAALIILLSSCTSTRQIQTAIGKKDTVIVTDTDRSRTDSIAFIRENYQNVLDKKINFTTFSAKIDVDYRESDGKKYDVNANLRMHKDSAIWISITAILGIEGLRTLITKDSVKILDKQNKVYTARSVSYLQEVTALPLDLYSLQDMLIGHPVFLDSNIVSYSINENSISLLSLGNYFKHLLTIGKDDKLIQSSKLDDVQEWRNRTGYLSYEKYEDKEGVMFPTVRLISISEKKKLDIRLNFKQYAFNEVLSFPFPIPKNYEHN